MSLKSRLAEAGVSVDDLGLGGRARAAAASKTASAPTPAEEVAAQTPLDELRTRAHTQLFERLGSRLYDNSLDEASMRSLVLGELEEILSNEQMPLSRVEHNKVLSDITANVLGLGPLEHLLADESVTEIMVIGTRPIFVERSGRLEASNSTFVSEDHLRRVIDRIVSKVGRRVDESTPMVDARLSDGSRINAVVPPLAVDGSLLTIRKFAKDPFTVDDLIRFKSLTAPIAAFLEAAVAAHVSILISGGTGTGKTTLLNVLSGWIDESERIVSIEDSVELRLRQPHVARLESRPPNIEGTGEIGIRDLVRNALRMRPDRIVVGEVRGGEALDMLQALNTGHEGSLTTLHANTPRDAVSRLETMVLMAGMDLPLRAIREQIASAVHLVVQLTRMSDGTRRVTDISEICGMEGDTIQVSQLFDFDWSAGKDENGKFLGVPTATGVVPTFEKKMTELGIELPQGIFGTQEELIEQWETASAKRRR